jgi:hypothetical protein
VTDARQRSIASLLARHTKLTAPDGHTIGCLCGAPDGRLDHHKHLAELIDQVIDATTARSDNELQAALNGIFTERAMKRAKLRRADRAS